MSRLDRHADGRSHHWAGYYPGDRYVDWLCVDAYNWNVPSWAHGRRSRPFSASRPKAPPSTATTHAAKPFMIGETGTDEDDAVDGRKASWFLNGRDALKTRFPLVKAVVYFNTVADNEDWRIETSASAIAAFRELANDSWFDTRRRRRR